MQFTQYIQNDITYLFDFILHSMQDHISKYQLNNILLQAINAA